MKVLFISPFYFGAESVIGGGERYAHELARAVSKKSETVLLTLDRVRRSECRENLRIERIPNLASLDFLRWIRWADVIHSHQIRFAHTDAAIILGKLFGKKVFLTDLGGGQPRCLSDFLPIRNMVNGFLLMSEFSKMLWVKRYPLYAAKTHVIGGGVDTSKFYSLNRPRNRGVVFVGRIVPHKGIEVLIEALSGDTPLEIIGKVYDPEYYEFLKNKALNKQVTFTHYLEDSVLTQRYQEAGVVVQPSVFKNYHGQTIEAPELFGLSAAEAMACGAPVIVSDAGSLPELIENEETGYIVPASNPEALREKINFLLQNPQVAEKISTWAASEAIKKFNWDTVADRCLTIYDGGGLK